MKSAFVVFSIIYLIVVSTACNVNDEQCYEIFSKKNNKKWTCQCIEADDNTADIQNTSENNPEYNKNNEDCEPYNPSVPDFSSPNRRLSVAKCYEYIWMIKKRKEEEERARKCNRVTLTIRQKRQLDEEISKKRKIPRHPENNAWTETTESITKTTFVLGGHDAGKAEFPHMERNNSSSSSLDDTLPDENPGLQLPEHRTQVLGGHDSFAAEFPHMGAIGWESADEEKWKFKCGSTLISPNFVITAAHCSQTSSRDTSVVDVVPKIVRFGVEDIVNFSTFRSPIDKNIVKIIVHPQYAPPKRYFDVALMQLDEDVILTKFVHPACLWTGDVHNFKEATVTGWGVTSEDARVGASFLQAATLNLIDDTTCDNLLKPKCSRLFCGLQSHQFCAGQLAGGIDACQGDSGGPIQSKIPLPRTADENMHYVIGVTSFGIGCGQVDLPGVYTKIPYFIDWIEGIIWH